MGDFEPSRHAKKIITKSNYKVQMIHGSIVETPDSLVAYARVIDNFAHQHFFSACLFRDHCIRIESSTEIDRYQAYCELRSYASATVMSTAAALEVLINELFIAHGSKLRKTIPDFDSEFWGSKGIERKPPIEKYKLALSLLGAPAFSNTSTIYRDAWALVELRNALVHFKPTWDPVEHKRVSIDQVLSGKYALSPFGNPLSDFVTIQSMSAGCATWAVRSTFAFIRDFDHRTNLDKDKMSGIFALET